MCSIVVLMTFQETVHSDWMIGDFIVAHLSSDCFVKWAVHLFCFYMHCTSEAIAVLYLYMVWESVHVFMDGMAPRTDSTNNNVWTQPAIQWSCNIDGNALFGIQTALTTVDGTNNSSSSFSVSSTKIAPTSSNQNQVAVSGLSSPSYTRFRRLFRKLKHALCELM